MGRGERIAPSPLPNVSPSVSAAGGAVSRDDIARIVDRFLSQRQPAAPPQAAPPPLPVAQPHAYVQQDVDVEPQRAAHSGGAAPHPEAAPTAQAPNGGGNGAGNGPAQRRPERAARRLRPAAGNGKRAVDFVCEDDVRRAIQKGEKIYTNARTIITPAARDMGEAAEVFAKA